MSRATGWGELFVMALVGVASASAQTFTTFTTLYVFADADTIGFGGLVQGNDGDLYGTTDTGDNSYGTIFKITPSGTLTTLYSFCSQPNCADGLQPEGKLIQAADGNLYGTTLFGGSQACSPSCGTVFKITPAGILTTLYTFHGTDGSYPRGGLIQANDANFYGTTGKGGTSSSCPDPGASLSSCGTIFRITPLGALTTLHSFDLTDGAGPLSDLVQGSDGNLYGTTYQGGTGCSTCGTVFKITLSGALTTLHSFDMADGAGPSALIQATDGNFYGTTNSGGVGICVSCGTIFKITPAGSLTTLYNFDLTQGAQPSALIQASDGNFYGTTSGTIFEITASGVLTTLYDFSLTGPDRPGTLIQGSDGNLYGITTGASGYTGATIFRLSSGPPPAINLSAGVVSAASFQPGIAPASWISIFGTNLSPVTDNWGSAIVGGNLPTSLDGVNVSVGGQPAYIAYVSATQINAVAPSVGPGTVSVTVTTPTATSMAVMALAGPVQPAFFQWGSYAVATHQDYSLAVKNGTFGGPTVPAKPGEVIILWGTGFGPTSPPAPLGMEVPPTTTYYTASPVTVTVGGTAATVFGAALTPGFAGLYQVAIQIPSSLPNGDYPVIATVSGTQSPTTLITVQK